MRQISKKKKQKQKTGIFCELQVFKGLLDLSLDSWEGFRKASGLQRQVIFVEHTKGRQVLKQRPCSGMVH